MKHDDKYLADLNKNPKNNLYLTDSDDSLVTDDRNIVPIQKGTLQMTQDEEKKYKSLKSPSFFLEVIKVGDTQFGYSIPKLPRGDLEFEFQSSSNDQSTKVYKGVEMCFYSQHLGFLNNLKSITDAKNSKKKTSWASIKDAELNLTIVNKKYTDSHILLYHGAIKSKEIGYKYIAVYTNFSRNVLYIYKFRGANIEQTILHSGHFQTNTIFFDQLFKVEKGNSSIFVIVDKVYSKLYFFNERSLLTENLNSNSQETRLNKIYRGVKDCHQL